MIHELKTWPQYFNQIASGRKRFEVRRADRNFQIGDILFLKEWDPGTDNYTGRFFKRYVTYILEGGSFGIERGYCILSLSIMQL